MMGMMGSVSSTPKAAATSDQLSVLRALARLLDPKAGPEIARIAASMPREDVARAIEGLKEMVDTLVALTPLRQPSRQRSRTYSAAKRSSPSAR
jgi:hypothetical protein